jgi:TRAP-type C4-dicarboxylate transport system permease small subunit
MLNNFRKEKEMGFKKIVKSINIVFEFIISSSMAVLTLLIFFQVLNRFLFHLPSTAWTAEMARYAFVWCSLLASVKVLKDKQHIQIGIIVEKLSVKIQTWLNYFSYILTLIFGYLLLTSGIHFTLNALNMTFEVGWFPVAPVYAIIPITGLLFMIISLNHIYELLKKNKKSELNS